MIGVLDWGIGGFGFYAALQRARPGTPVLYFSDAGFTPYGKVPAARLSRRVLLVLGELRRRGATHVVIACNAASTVLPALGVADFSGEVITPDGPVVVTGIIAHALERVRQQSPAAVGVIGGMRTIRSGAYARPLRSRGIEVHQRIAQPLSARVERGDLDSAALQRELRDILGPLQRVPALLLACTHYAALTPLLHSHLPDAVLLDPVDALTRWVVAHWRPTRAGRSTFLTTGDAAAMRVAAQRAFDVKLSSARRVTL